MIDRSLATISGIIGTVSALVVDLLIYGGDALAAILVYLLADIDLILQFVAYLSTLSRHVAWIPEAMVQELYVALIVIMLAVLIVRTVARWYDRRGST